MASNNIELLKDTYTKELENKGLIDEAERVKKLDIFDPIYDPIYVHGEQEVKEDDINNSINNIICDISIINSELSNTASNVKELMENIDLQLASVKSLILQEKDNQQDLNMLCNSFTEFDLVIPVSDSDFSGTFSSDNNVFSMYSSSFSKNNISVENISGNGYEGNKYVYNNAAFQQNNIDTSNRSYINDSSIITVYEYSRLTADTSELNYPPEVNFDSIEATCSIVLKSDIKFNMIKIDSDSKNLKLISVSTSSDGVNFSQINEEILDLKTQDKSYNAANYIPDSGILCFPDTLYLKLVLQSSGYTTDTIAFYKTIIND